MSVQDEAAVDFSELGLIIERSYGTSEVSLHRLTQGEQIGKDVYRVARENGPDWVLRVYHSLDAVATDDSLKTLTSVLLFLEQQCHPAEVVVRSVNGALYVTQDDMRLLVTTYLGQSLQVWHPASAGTLAAASLFDYSPVSLLAFGEALGQLHALPVGDAALPPAGMLPEPEIAWAAECLVRCAQNVPPALEAEYQILIEEIQRFDCLRSLPQCLVHNDCNFGNVVQTPAGKIALVDWEGAGLGPALLDVGFVLSACFDKPRRHLNREAICAFADGYRRSRTLTASERDLLADAVRFRTLVLLACCFSDRVCGTLPNDAIIYGAVYSGWQAQHQASAEIADTAHKAFQS